MDERRQTARELDDIQKSIKELQMLYEQYFAGIERREPVNDRKAIAKRIRHFTNRHIVWTDLKFRYQGLASRFMTYCQYWDRIQRQIEEGKYHRHTAKLPNPSHHQADPGTPGITETKNLQQQLAKARKDCGLSGNEPSVEKISAFLKAQQEQIRNRYGNKPVEYSVETHNGKPQIKVRPKQ